MANLSYALHDVIIAALRAANCTIGLLTSAPNPDGTGISEPSAQFGYSRQPVSWEATVRDPTTGRSIIKNATSLLYGPAVSNAWPTVNYLGVFGSDGTLLVYCPLAASRTTSVGDTMSFGVEAVQLRFN